MKIKTSKKKFYHKFDYKISLNIPGCSSLRYHSTSETINWLEQGNFPKFYLSERTQLSVISNRPILIDLCMLLSEYNSDTWQKRIERDNIDIYTSDSDLVKDLKENLSLYITDVYEPCSASIKPGTISVKKLPGDIYNYRVYLLPHKLKNNMEEKQKYISWIRGQKNKIKITESVEYWFYKTDWNWDPRYILVDEESTLLMLKLRNPEIVGRVYQFVIG